jgi:hypothetical protein
MEVVYGIKPTLEDPYVHNAEEALVGVSDAATPGRYLVETFPIMKNIPAWFPGAGWRRKANYYRDVNREVCFRPWNLVKEQMVSSPIKPHCVVRFIRPQKAGIAPPSVAASLMDKLPDVDVPNRTYEETVAINTCAVSFIGMQLLILTRLT